jgi:hypothetical protein
MEAGCKTLYDGGGFFMTSGWRLIFERQGRPVTMTANAVMVEDLKQWLRLQGVTPLGVRELEPKLPDWERVLRSRGVNAVPDMRLAHKWTQAQHDDFIQMMALYTQAAQTAHKHLKVPRKLERMLAQLAHQYRDMSGIRELSDPS